MKKLASPKLKLQRETLRKLEDRDLVPNVAGGASGPHCTIPFTFWVTCHPT